MTFEFDKEIFFEFTFIDTLNDKLRGISERLDGYVLTADNFLKMILIYTRIKANLPVVILGETGWYLFSKILRCVVFTNA